MKRAGAYAPAFLAFGEEDLMVAEVGLEPTTNDFKGRRATLRYSALPFYEKEYTAVQFFLSFEYSRVGRGSNSPFTVIETVDAPVAVKQR